MVFPFSHARLGPRILSDIFKYALVTGQFGISLASISFTSALVGSPTISWNLLDLSALLWSKFEYFVLFSSTVLIVNTAADSFIQE